MAPDEILKNGLCVFTYDEGFPSLCTFLSPGMC